MKKRNLIGFLLYASACGTKIQGSKADNDMLFAKNNLLVWCIVPFDSKKRTYKERAQMLKELGISALAYDMRDAHLLNLETEFNTLKRYNIQMKGIWFWINVEKDQVLNNANETILKTLAKTNTKTELG